MYVLGASRQGKSSFIKLLYRDIKPTKGTVTVCGHNVGKLKNHAIHHLRREIGIVFQDCKLLTGKTVFENIAFALEVMGEDTEAISEKVHRSLETVGLADKADSYPGPPAVKSNGLRLHVLSYIHRKSFLRMSLQGTWRPANVIGDFSFILQDQQKWDDYFDGYA